MKAIIYLLPILLFSGLIGCGQKRQPVLSEYQKDSIEAVKVAMLHSKDTVVKEYYYMWSFNVNGDHGWGENTIKLNYRPSPEAVRSWVWEEFRKELPIKYTDLKISVEESSRQPGALQNLDPITKAQIGIYKN